MPQRRRNGAPDRRPSVRPTMRCRARSTTGQSHTLRALRPTKAPVSSGAKTSHALRCALAGRNGGRTGGGAAAFLATWHPSNVNGHPLIHYPKPERGYCG